MPGAPSSVRSLLVAMPFVPSSVLVPTSSALRVSKDQKWLWQYGHVWLFVFPPNVLQRSGCTNNSSNHQGNHQACRIEYLGHQ